MQSPVNRQRREKAIENRPNAHDPRRKASPIESRDIPICTRAVARIQISHMIPPSPDQKHGDERRRLRDVVPGTDGDGYDRDEIPAAPDVDPFGTEGCEVHSCGCAVEDYAEG
ncbi:hypothetical protein BST61_g5573 [Cercospora zeina]